MALKTRRSSFELTDGVRVALICSFRTADEGHERIRGTNGQARLLPHEARELAAALIEAADEAEQGP